MSNKKKEEVRQSEGTNQVWPFALMSLVALIIGLTLLIVLVWHADKIVSLGLTGKLYYIVLLPLGLCVSFALFGVLRSIGRYRGKVFGGALELGGPAVGFFLVIILGFYLPQPAQDFSMTIIVHGPKGNGDMILRSRGSILLDTGGQRRPAQIGPNGDAVFLEIPANLRGQKASLGLDAEGFELVESHNEVTLSPSTIYIEVRWKPGRLAGNIKTPDGLPLAGVTVSVGKTRTTTDDQGYFEMQVTGEEANNDVTLVATTPGYELWTGLEVPNSNDITIELQKKN